MQFLVENMTMRRFYTKSILNSNNLQVTALLETHYKVVQHCEDLDLESRGGGCR